MSTSPSRPSNPRTVSANTNTHTNPTTPLSPFPSTPHRLSYHDYNPTTTGTSSPSTSTPSTTGNPFSHSHIHTHITTTGNNFPLQISHEHISPTKAAATTRLNHELSTLTSWLESLFPNNEIPAHLAKWRGEVLLSEQGSFDGPVIGSFEANLNQHPIFSQSQSQGQRGNQQHHRSTTDTNPSTSPLDLLKSLKQINLSQDYLSALLHDARLEELQTLRTQQAQLERQRSEQVRARMILDEVYGYLTPDAVDALGSLSEAAVTLGLDLDVDGDVDVERVGNGDGNGNGTASRDLVSLYARGILGQIRRKFMLEEQVRELESLRDRIDSRISNDTAGGEDQESDDHQSEQLHAQTAQFNRDTKQINLKIMEYHDRVTSLERQLASHRTGSTSLEDVLNARTRVEERRARVKALQERFAAFNGLPPDLEDSRNEVKRAMAELESLKRRRDGLFERMGTG